MEKVIQVSDSCDVSYQEVVKKIKHWIETDSDITLTIYSEEKKNKLLKALNEVPPETNFEAKKIIVSIRKGFGAIVVLVGDDDCVSQVLKFPVEPWKKLEDKALNDDS